MKRGCPWRHDWSLFPGWYFSLCHPSTSAVQNAAVPLIFRLYSSEHIADALVSLHWLRVPERIVQEVQSSKLPCILIRRCMLMLRTFSSRLYAHRWQINQSINQSINQRLRSCTTEVCLSGRHTFHCWKSRLSCRWCLYMERFIFGLLTVSA